MAGYRIIKYGVFVCENSKIRLRLSHPFHRILSIRICGYPYTSGSLVYINTNHS